MMKYCTNCGKENEDNVKFCVQCGKDFDGEKVEEVAPETEVVNLPSAPTKYSGNAIAAFVVACVGIIIMPLICGFVGLSLSIASFQQIKKNNMKGKGFVIAAIIISVVNIVWGIAIKFMS